VQGLVAAGRDPARVRRGGSRSPLGYLRSLVGSDGAIRYSRTSTQTPVWVTAQALTALAGKAFPLAPAPRKRRAHATATPTPTPTPTPAAREEKPRAPEPEPAVVSSSAPPPAVALFTPEARRGLELPRVTPERAHRAGLIAAVLVRTWLPRT
jgi:hypothetical protein